MQLHVNHTILLDFTKPLEYLAIHTVKVITTRETKRKH